MFFHKYYPWGFQKGGVAINPMVTNFFRAPLTCLPPISNIGAMEQSIPWYLAPKTPFWNYLLAKIYRAGPGWLVQWTIISMLSCKGWPQTPLGNIDYEKSHFMGQFILQLFLQALYCLYLFLLYCYKAKICYIWQRGTSLYAGEHISP